MTPLHHFYGINMFILEKLEWLWALVLVQASLWTFSDTLQWSGAVTGLAGAYLLALNAPISKWGWLGFFVANIFIGGFAYVTGANGLLVQQIGFTGSSILGIWRSDFSWLKSAKDMLERRRNARSGQRRHTQKKRHVSNVEFL